MFKNNLVLKFCLYDRLFILNRKVTTKHLKIVWFYPDFFKLLKHKVFITLICQFQGFSWILGPWMGQIFFENIILLS